MSGTRKGGGAALPYKRHNVALLEADAETMRLDDEFDAILFGLSYAIIPDQRAELQFAWVHLASADRRRDSRPVPPGHGRPDRRPKP